MQKKHVTGTTQRFDLALEYALDGDTELRELEAALARAEEAHDGGKIASLHERLYQIDAYTARARAATLLDGLGFTQQMQGKTVAERKLAGARFTVMAFEG